MIIRSLQPSSLLVAIYSNIQMRISLEFKFYCGQELSKIERIDSCLIIDEMFSFQIPHIVAIGYNWIFDLNEPNISHWFLIKQGCHDVYHFLLCWKKLHLIKHNHSLLVLEFSRTPFCMSAVNIYHMTLATRHDPEKYQINILILLIYEQ
jgi:hypothetical protein